MFREENCSYISRGVTAAAPKRALMGDVGSITRGDRGDMPPIGDWTNAEGSRDLGEYILLVLTGARRPFC